MSEKLSLSLSKKPDPPQRPALKLKLVIPSTERVESTSHPKRAKICQRLLKIAEFEGRDELVIQCEECLYQAIKNKTKGDFPESDFERAYVDRAMTVIRNLDSTSSVGNHWLANQVVSGEISPEQLADMDAKDFYPDKWEHFREARRKQIQTESQQKEVTTDLFKCNKCKKRQCTYYQLQIRSSDEPMTTFITCTSCGAKWQE